MLRGRCLRAQSANAQCQLSTALLIGIIARRRPLPCCMRSRLRSKSVGAKRSLCWGPLDYCRWRAAERAVRAGLDLVAAVSGRRRPGAEYQPTTILIIPCPTIPPTPGSVRKVLEKPKLSKARRGARRNVVLFSGFVFYRGGCGGRLRSCNFYRRIIMGALRRCKLCRKCVPLNMGR
jgi:hypothetical protein